MPDDKFMAQGAILMFFPDHDPGQWPVGNKITQAASEPLWAYYKPGIDSQAPKVFSLMSNMPLGRPFEKRPTAKTVLLELYIYMHK